MQNIEKFIHMVTGLIFFSGAILLLSLLLDAEEQRERVLISDMSHKSGVHLSLDGEDGNRQYTQAEVLTSILYADKDVRVFLEHVEISYELRRDALSGLARISVPEGTYLSRYEFDALGNAGKVTFYRI